ncbi:MAG: S8 family serine peptidase [Gemmatimonadales bacterium]|nr:S8 family serine peptidase [Gemmatimonadales bacterium]
MREPRRAAALALCAALAGPALQAQQGSAPGEPAVPPAVAARLGLMPLASTRVDVLRAERPTSDGRGVLIGILDSGVDAGIPGLGLTSTGERKLLDLRDFSGEGRVVLEPLEPTGDAVVVGGTLLRGFGAMRARAPKGPWFGGTLAERPLGALPASDLDGDGDDTDALPVIVTKATDGWVLFADTDGDGSLEREAPVHDYRQAFETFGYGGARAPITLAANFGPEPAARAAPQLDLYFDTSGHGSHVAGIAAGHRMYGVAGFDGVAPGAQLLGLKISDNAQGGLTTTGAMRRAIAYAVAFARERRMPLVLNMSFGVGNEEEGRAGIDAYVDSVLAANPDVVFTISAGNDGPGLSTVGFPGSASRAISVAATWPAPFLRAQGHDGPEAVAYFSSRGGETGKPDLAAPGAAFSTVPAWDRGGEIEYGTSMASPHAAGLAAVLVSALVQEGRPVRAARIRRALMVTARPTPGATALDDGAGLPDVAAAWRWLATERRATEVEAIVAGTRARAAFRADGFRGPADTLQAWDLARDDAAPETFTLRSDVPWLVPPRSVTVGARGAVVVRVRAAALRDPGVWTGTVTGWPKDTLAGPAFRLVHTVVVPVAAAPAEVSLERLVPAGGVARVPVPAEEGRAFDVRVEAAPEGTGAMAQLYEPGGRPRLGGGEVEVAGGPAGATLGVDGADAVAGTWELAAVAMPGSEPPRVRVTVRRSPVRLDASLATAGGEASVRAIATNATAAEARGAVTALAVGAASAVALAPSGGARRTIRFTPPAWATRIAIDAVMPREQWPRFTDFGLSLFEADGRQLAKEPLNYHRARLEASLPPGRAPAPLSIGLFPGLDDPADARPWTMTVVVKCYADSALTLVRATEATVDTTVALTLPPRGAREVGFRTAALPAWDGGRPEQGTREALVTLVFEQDGRSWTHERRLPVPGGQP